MEPVTGTGGSGFPDVRWGRDPGPLVKRPITALLGTRVGAWCVRALTPLDLRLLRRSNGRFTVLGPFGVPLLLLTTTGRRSGQPRQTPLTYLRDGDRLFVTGSNFGQRDHPAWTSNLLTDPNGWVTIGGLIIPVYAQQLGALEADQIYRRFVDYAANYGAYQDRAHRAIRVFALTERATEAGERPWGENDG